MGFDPPDVGRLGSDGRAGFLGGGRHFGRERSAERQHAGRQHAGRQHQDRQKSHKTLLIGLTAPSPTAT
jgi:hypothetical protein